MARTQRSIWQCWPKCENKESTQIRTQMHYLTLTSWTWTGNSLNFKFWTFMFSDLITNWKSLKYIIFTNSTVLEVYLEILASCATAATVPSTASSVASPSCLSFSTCSILPGEGLGKKKDMMLPMAGKCKAIIWNPVLALQFYYRTASPLNYSFIHLRAKILRIQSKHQAKADV